MNNPYTKRNPHGRIPVVHKGTRYPSIHDLAKATGAARSTLARYIKKYPTVEEAVERALNPPNPPVGKMNLKQFRKQYIHEEGHDLDAFHNALNVAMRSRPLPRRSRD